MNAPGEALAALRARADAAMYESKGAGKAHLRWTLGETTTLYPHNAIHPQS